MTQKYHTSPNIKLLWWTFSKMVYIYLFVLRDFRSLVWGGGNNFSIIYLDIMIEKSYFVQPYVWEERAVSCR